jgi:hypothetical protein
MSARKAAKPRKSRSGTSYTYAERVERGLSVTRSLLLQDAPWETLTRLAEATEKTRSELVREGIELLARKYSRTG